MVSYVNSGIMRLGLVLGGLGGLLLLVYLFLFVFITA